MKYFLLSFTFTLIAIISPFAVKAVDVSVGATVWYASWDFKSKSEFQTDTMKLKAELMYGPLAAVKISQDWSVSSVFLYSSSYETPDDSIKRMDSDTVVNYTFNKYLKFFAGNKFMRFSFKTGYHQSDGPGGGLGATMPIIENLYLLGNGSVYYLFGSHKDDGGKKNMRESGFSAAGALAYYLEPASTTFTAGYRYQFFKTKYISNDTYNSSDEHTFKGFTASIVYSF
jgi:hypothetical protein